MAGEQVSEAVLRELYQGDPAEFVAVRDRRAEQAREAGDEALAAAIKALRKPTTAAWAVNRVSTGQRDRVAELIGVGDELRAAQRELRGDEIRRLDRRRAELVRELTERAANAVSRAGKQLGEQARRQVESTFAAAVAEPESARRVQSGALSGALTYSGFGLDELSVAAMRGATSSRRGHDSGARRGGRRRAHTKAGRAGAAKGAARPELSGADAEERTTGVVEGRPPGERETRRKSGAAGRTTGKTRKAEPAGPTSVSGAAAEPAGGAEEPSSRGTDRRKAAKRAGGATAAREQAPRPGNGGTRRGARAASSSAVDEAAERLRQAEDELRAAEEDRDDQERQRDELRARLDDLSARLRETTRTVSKSRRRRDTARRRYDSVRQRR